MAETGVGTGPEMAGAVQTCPLCRAVCMSDRLSTGGAALQPACSTVTAFSVAEV